jgi:hypothetical protein
MISIVIVFMVGLTSLAAYRLGTRVLELPASRLRAAGRRVLEGLGLVLIFFTANVAIWLGAILATRALTGWFVSAYLFNDVTVGILSLLQGLMFLLWRNPRDRVGAAGTDGVDLTRCRGSP